MFVTFRTDAYEDITYFNDVAKRLLALMGHSGTVPGAITADQLPAALDSLQQGLELEKNKTPSVRHDNDDDNEPEISLVKRAIPLLNLLQAAIKKSCDVVWVSAKYPGI